MIYIVKVISIYLKGRIYKTMATGAVIEESIEEIAKAISMQYDGIIWLNNNNQIVIDQDADEFCRMGFFGGEMVLQ